MIYVHIKGPDEFGHDGDAIGKKQNIEKSVWMDSGELLPMIKMYVRNRKELSIQFVIKM